MGRRHLLQVLDLTKMLEVGSEGPEGELEICVPGAVTQGGPGRELIGKAEKPGTFDQQISNVDSGAGAHAGSYGKLFLLHNFLSVNPQPKASSDWLRAIGNVFEELWQENFLLPRKEDQPFVLLKPSAGSKRLIHIMEGYLLCTVY